MFARDKPWRLWAGAVALWSGAVWGQELGRSGHSWNVPGGSGRMVTNTLGGDFGTHSYGLGGLQGPGAYGGSDILRSGLESGLASTGSYDILRGPAGQAPGGLSAGFSRTPEPIGQGLALPRLALPDPLAGPGLSAAMGALSDNVPDALAYLVVMGYTSGLKSDEKKEISSFVPAQASIYQENMKRGEELFRTRQYPEAKSAFRIAASIADRAPESYLSLTHADFAEGRFYSAAGNLQMALRYFPELPLVRLRVRGFFGRPEEFLQLLGRLEEKCQGRGVPADMWLLLAYFRYFDGREREAADALGAARKALPARQPADDLRAAEREATEEAIETFWDGMVAAGKAHGPLTTQPADSGPTTRPADAGPERPHPSAPAAQTGAGPEEGDSRPKGPGG